MTRTFGFAARACAAARPTTSAYAGGFRLQVLGLHLDDVGDARGGAVMPQRRKASSGGFRRMRAARRPRHPDEVGMRRDDHR